MKRKTKKEKKQEQKPLYYPVFDAPERIESAIHKDPPYKMAGLHPKLKAKLQKKGN